MQRRITSWSCVWVWIFFGLLVLGFSDTAAAQTVTVSPSGQGSPLSFLNVPTNSVSSAQQVSISSSIATTVTIQVQTSWLVVSPNGPVNVASASTSSINVRVNTQGLAQGCYQGTFTVAQAQQVVATVFVNLTVSGSSLLSANPSSLTFTANQGASSGPPSSSVVSISSSGAQLNYTLSSSTTDGNRWLLTSPSSGTTGGAGITVSVNPAVLNSVGTFQGTIVVSSTTTQDATSISVTLTISANATLTVTPSTLPPFLFQVGGDLPASQQLQVTSTGGSVSFSLQASPAVPWLVL